MTEKASKKFVHIDDPMAKKLSPLGNVTLWTCNDLKKMDPPQHLRLRVLKVNKQAETPITEKARKPISLKINNKKKWHSEKGKV